MNTLARNAQWNPVVTPSCSAQAVTGPGRCQQCRPGAEIGRRSRIVRSRPGPATEWQRDFAFYGMAVGTSGTVLIARKLVITSTICSRLKSTAGCTVAC